MYRARRDMQHLTHRRLFKSWKVKILDQIRTINRVQEGELERFCTVPSSSKAKTIFYFGLQRFELLLAQCWSHYQQG